MRKPSTCHPEKPNHGRGLCTACYQRAKRATPAGREQANGYARKEWSRIRARVLDRFGRECSRCGFADERALQLDHIAGGGCQEKAAIGTHQIYKRALKHPEDYQVLCANCNTIKRIENGEHRQLGENPLLVTTSQEDDHE